MAGVEAHFEDCFVFMLGDLNDARSVVEPQNVGLLHQFEYDWAMVFISLSIPTFAFLPSTIPSAENRERLTRFDRPLFLHVLPDTSPRSGT